MSDGKRVVSLVGMPGGGKSTVGRLLAKRLGVAFFDVDREIEELHDCSVAQLFERDGEAAFRAAESEMLLRLVAHGEGVIATGGGSILSPANRAMLRDATVPVYLEASLAVLWRRVRRNAKRPLLQVADPYARLQELFDERHPLYREVARITVTTGVPSTSDVVTKIVAHLERLGPP